MIKTVYNFNKMVIEMLSKMNHRLESKYHLVPLSFDEVAMNLNGRIKE